MPRQQSRRERAPIKDRPRHRNGFHLCWDGRIQGSTEVVGAFSVSDNIGLGLSITSSIRPAHTWVGSFRQHGVTQNALVAWPPYAHFPRHLQDEDRLTS